MEVVFAFTDIDKDYAEAFSQERGGLNYTVTATVLGYNFNDEGTDVEDPVVAVARRSQPVRRGGR